MRREERSANSQEPQPGAGREQQADADPAHGQDPQAVLDPARAAGHVLQDEGDRHRDAGDEAAAGQIVAAQEEDTARQRRSPETCSCMMQRRDREVSAHGIADLHGPDALRRGVLKALLLGDVDALGGRTETAQQGVDRERHDARAR